MISLAWKVFVTTEYYFFLMSDSGELVDTFESGVQAFDFLRLEA